MQFNNGNQFRQPPAGITPPDVMPPNMSQPLHPQQTGMTSAPINTTHTWHFRHESSIDRKVYEGQFTCKKLSLMELSRLGVRKVQLNGGYHFDEKRPGVGIEEHVDNMNSMLAHLELAIVQAPVWFNPEYLYDPEILQAIYMEVASFENSFFRPERSAPKLRQSGPDDRSGEGKESGTAGRVAAVGGKEMAASLDP